MGDRVLLSEPDLSPLAWVILDTIHAKGRGVTQTEIAQAEYELQKHGLIAFGCCNNRFLSIEGALLAKGRAGA